MKPKDFYSETAKIYDIRHESPTTKHLRRFEGKAVKRFSRGMVLDAGCGTGRWMDHASVGIDISRDMLKLCKKKSLVIGNNEAIPFTENAFDTILCMFSILNVSDHEKTIGEFARILKFRGKVIISVSSLWDRNYTFQRKMELRKGGRSKQLSYKKFRVLGKHTILKLFSKEELIEMFRKRGFELVFFDSVFILQKPHWNNFRRFSLPEKIKLFIERFLPFRDLGCFYVMVFSKTASSTT